MNRNNIKYVFLVIVTLLFINSACSEPTKIGLLNNNDKDYGFVDKLVSSLFLKNPFKILKVDGGEKDKIYYDFCSKSFFECNRTSGQLSGIHLTYDPKMLKKSLKRDYFQNDYTLDNVELSLFSFNDQGLLNTINAYTVKISLCDFKGKDNLTIAPNEMTTDLYVDSNDNVKVNIKRMKNVKNFILTSSLVREESKEIIFDMEDIDEIEQYNFKNWDIYSTRVPNFGSNFNFETLKLTLLSKIDVDLDRPDKFKDYIGVSKFLLYKYKYFDFDPIPFPKEIFEDNDIIKFFGTTFRILPTTSPLDISSATSLYGLSFSNAEGFVYNETNRYYFPFSKFPQKLDQFYYKNNDIEIPLPDIQRIFENTKILYLALPNNKFTGEIAAINIPSLISLDLSNNELSGTLDDWVCDIAELNVENNILYGEVPACKICYGVPSLIETDNYFNSRSCFEVIHDSLSVSIKEYNVSTPKQNSDKKDNLKDGKDDGDDDKKDKDEGLVFSITYEYTVKGEGLANGLSKFRVTNFTQDWTKVGKDIFKTNSTQKVEYLEFNFNTSTPVPPITLAIGSNTTPKIRSISKSDDNDEKESKTAKYTIEGILFSESQSEVTVTLFDYEDDEYKPYPCEVISSTFTTIVASCQRELLLNYIKVGVGQADTGYVKFNSTLSKSNMCKSKCSPSVAANDGGCDFEAGLCKCPNCKSVSIEVTGECVHDENGDAHCSCTNRWEGKFCEIGNCYGYDGCNPPKGECNKATSMCDCVDRNFDNDYCNGTRTISDGKNNNNGDGGNGDDGENGSSYTVGIVFLFIVIIGVAIFIYKRYVDSSSNSNASNGIKFKVLSSRQEDEEDSLSTRKEFEDEE
ncbi:hypothetical protein ACTFIV_008605 [Dictyostelium citrinum]